MDLFTGLGTTNDVEVDVVDKKRWQPFDIAYLIVPRSDDQVPSLLKRRRASMPLQTLQREVALAPNEAARSSSELHPWADSAGSKPRST